MSEPEARLARCCVFHRKKAKDKRITYAEEVGEGLQDCGCGVESIPPVGGRHAGRTVLRGPVVQEVGEQLGRPSRAVEALVEDGGEERVCQQRLDSKGRDLIIVTLVASERSTMTVAENAIESESVSVCYNRRESRGGQLCALVVVTFILLQQH